jgi:DNA polymerase-1
VYKYIKDDSNFYDLALELSEGNVKEVYCDLETEGLDCRLHKILLFQIMANDEIYIFDFLHLNNEHLKYLVNLLDNVAKVTSVFHNTKFDIKFLAHYTGIWMTHLYDTMNAEVLINAGIGKSTYKLEELALKYAGVQLNKEVREQFFTQEIKIITEQMLQYSAEDVMVLKPIYEQQIDQIRNAKEEKILKIEMELLPSIAKMEYDGVPINEEEWRKIEAVEHERYDRMDELLKDLFLKEIKVETYPDAYKLAQAISYPMSNLSKKKEDLLKSLTTPDVLEGWFRENFNVNSTYQMQAALKLSGVNTNTTDVKILKKLERTPIIEAILEKSESGKRVSQYGLNVIGYFHPCTGRIHTEFLNMGAASGRLSSGNPMNLQNIPRVNGYRECFIAPKGYKWISADYSQQEFRLAGAISGEQIIIDAYRAGADMHTATATLIYKKPLNEIVKQERFIGKTANFTIVYGGTEYALQKNLGLTEETSLEILKAFHEGYPAFSAFKKAAEKSILSLGYSTTVLGRRRYNEPKPTYQSNKEYMRYVNKQKREGFNHIIQGTAADITKIAMLINIPKNNPFGDKLRMLIQVHDELNFEAHESIADDAAVWIKEEMLKAEQPFLGDIPAAVDVSLLEDGSLPTYWKH